MTQLCYHNINNCSAFASYFMGGKELLENIIHDETKITSQIDESTFSFGYWVPLNKDVSDFNFVEIKYIEIPLVFNISMTRDRLVD